MTVTIQQGHVPRTRGATGAPGEQAYNRAVAAKAAQLLRAQGVGVKIIVADPSSYPRSRDFIAVHYDGSVNPSAQGASVGYPDAAGGQLAGRWKAAYRAEGFPGGFRGDNYTRGLARYYAYSRANSTRRMVSEGGFGSHPTEGPWLRSKAGIATCARAIARAVTGAAPPGQPSEEDDMIRADQEGPEVRQFQHTLSRFIYETGGELDGGGKAHDKNGSHLEPDGVYGPKSRKFCRHAIWRAEKWILDHPIYGSSDPVTPLTEAWLVEALGRKMRK